MIKNILLLLFIIFICNSNSIKINLSKGDVLPTKPPSLLYSLNTFPSNTSLTITNIQENYQKTFVNISLPSYINILSIISIKYNVILMFGSQFGNNSAFNYMLFNYYIKQNTFQIISVITDIPEYLNLQSDSIGYNYENNYVFGMETNVQSINIYQFDFNNLVITQIVNLDQFGFIGSAAACFDQVSHSYYISYLSADGLNRDFLLFNVLSKESYIFTINDFNSTNDLQLISFNKTLFIVEYQFQKKLLFYQLITKNNNNSLELKVSLPYDLPLYSALLTPPTKEGYTVLMSSTSGSPGTYTIFSLNDSEFTTLYTTAPLPTFSYIVGSN